VKLAFIILLSITVVQLAYANEREDCRKKTTTSEIADCIERGVYDPCDDAGGTWGRAMCAYAHTEVAERKMAKSEQEIIFRLKKAQADKRLETNFLSVQKAWRDFRGSYCKFTNAVNDYGVYFDSSSRTHYGFCLRRLTEAHLKELEMILERDDP
jgi:uncharacterized protein YecT (DUF1311 family)